MRLRTLALLALLIPLSGCAAPTHMPAGVPAPQPCPAPFQASPAPCPDPFRLAIDLAGCSWNGWIFPVETSRARTLLPVGYDPAELAPGVTQATAGVYLCQALQTNQSHALGPAVFADLAIHVRTPPPPGIGQVWYLPIIYSANANLTALLATAGFPVHPVQAALDLAPTLGHTFDLTLSDADGPLLRWRQFASPDSSRSPNVPLVRFQHGAVENATWLDMQRGANATQAEDAVTVATAMRGPFRDLLATDQAVVDTVPYDLGDGARLALGRSAATVLSPP